MSDSLENLLQRDAQFLRANSDRYDLLQPSERLVSRKGQRLVGATLLAIACASAVAIMAWPEFPTELEVTAASEAEMSELRENQRRCG